jgi:trehalose utilization protein
MAHAPPISHAHEQQKIDDHGTHRARRGSFDSATSSRGPQGFISAAGAPVLAMRSQRTSPRVVPGLHLADCAIVNPIRVTVWGENYHENLEGDSAGMAERYPEGMHGAIAAGLRNLLGDAVEVRTATQDQPEHGLTEEVLASTDVLTWWGHATHAQVDDAVVERVHQRILGGMGLLVLHSAHFSKIFIRLMGTTCSLAWRNAAEVELVWTVTPAHPIARGVPQPITIGEQEMYGEYFDIPTPDELIFISNFSGGEVFRSGCCWRRGNGKVFYFSPGDQEYPVYWHPDVQRVLANAVQWARPDPGLELVSPKVINSPAPRLSGGSINPGVNHG